MKNDFEEVDNDSDNKNGNTVDGVDRDDMHDGGGDER